VTLDVQPVRDRADRKRFINYQYDRNRNDPHFVPPLRIGEFERIDPKKNPFWLKADLELFLARRNGRVVGRIGAIDDHLHQERHKDDVGMFGFYEADDAEATRALLLAVEDWAKARGKRAVRGPVNPSMNDNCGLLIEGYDTDPMLLMPHNPREYGSFIESAGYAKVKDLYAWLYELGNVPPVVEKLAERRRERLNLTLRTLKMDEFERDADRLRDIYTSAWENNWGFVPPSYEEFRHIAKEMKPIFDTRGAIVAEVDGRLVACIVALPDINQALKGTDGKLFPKGLVRLLMRNRYIDQGRILLLGVDREYRSQGLFPLLLVELNRRIAGSQYKRVEFSWILENNRDINQPAEAAGARLYKKYRIYQKAL